MQAESLLRKLVPEAHRGGGGQAVFTVFEVAEKAGKLVRLPWGGDLPMSREDLLGLAAQGWIEWKGTSGMFVVTQEGLRRIR